MNSAVVVEAPRRPLSGGLWTLFSWLRRDDQNSSSESLSSVGSARTAASFAFLAPAHYDTTPPVLLPPPAPPTDSYRKRVHDRNLRRQHDRDITLHRKYGLYGYDAFTLPNSRRGVGTGTGGPVDRCERDRRAASECLQRRVHVPGKRRAPLPPATTTTYSLTRRRARKRPAPLPPVNFHNNKANNSVNIGNVAPMNRHSWSKKENSQSYDNSMECKSEKYSKKDTQTKEVKTRNGKSFLNQIFDSKKRNSAIETASVKLLPSISELDRQAVEMIEKYRLKEVTHSNSPNTSFEINNLPSTSSEAWICTKCLKKYDATVITCTYCLPLNKIDSNTRKLSNNCTQTNAIHNKVPYNSSKERTEEKEKLKVMLKEIKDSLPQRYPKTVEAPTLRIGSSVLKDERDISVGQSLSTSSGTEKAPLSSNTPLKADKKQLVTIDHVLITKPIVLVHTKDNIVSNITDSNTEKLEKLLPIKTEPARNAIENTDKNAVPKPLENKTPKDSKNSLSSNINLHKPLNISSLLNPIYVPKVTTTVGAPPKYPIPTISMEVNKTTPQAQILPDASQNVDVMSTGLSTTSPQRSANVTSNRVQHQREVIGSDIKDNKIRTPITTQSITSESPLAPKVNYTDTKPVVTGLQIPSSSIGIQLDQHSKRRNLINQLEISIAKGDERSAAEAAVKLAQLRLSCSVLSFSSQIVSQVPVPLNNTPLVNVSNVRKETENKKIEEKSQNLPASQSCLNENKQSPERVVSENVSLEVNKELPLVEIKKDLQTKSTTNSNSERKTLGNEMSVNIGASTSAAVINNQNNESDEVPILIWVEDKETTRGPVQLHVQRNGVMGELRKQAERSLGLAAQMQRWIVGRTLCSDDNTPLATVAGPELTAPFYLCLVESETKTSTALPQNNTKADDADNVYNELVKLEMQALVPNSETFECGVCMEECKPGDGAVLRECVHSFCKECLVDVVRHSEEPVISCPAVCCPGVLQEREIRAVVTHEEYETWLARGLAAAESGTRNAFHCRTRDCTGWALCDPGVRRFPCPVCGRTNCLLCQAIHEGETCEQYRIQLKKPANSGEGTDEGTRALLNTLISRGEALECPECSAIITKKWGCDWVKCSACKTEICWVTKGRRWGPSGRGDTSGGCRCGVDGKRCHPSCGYCH